MGFWTKSVLIFKSLCENANQSIRQLACQTGMSKSSVHRLTQAIARRDRSPESWLWETEDGRRWLTRLVVAALYTFGLKRGVGLETLSEFFTHLHLETQVGCLKRTPSSRQKRVRIKIDSCTDEMKPPRSKLRGYHKKGIVCETPRFLTLFPLQANPGASSEESPD